MFAQIHYFWKYVWQIQGLNLGKHKFFFFFLNFMLTGVYLALGRENQRMKYPHTKKIKKIKEWRCSGRSRGWSVWWFTTLHSTTSLGEPGVPPPISLSTSPTGWRTWSARVHDASHLHQHDLTRPLRRSTMLFKPSRLMVYRMSSLSAVTDRGRDGPRYKAKGARAPPGPKNKIF